MFVARRTFLNNNRLGCYICTGSARNCDKPRKHFRITDRLLEEADDIGGSKRKKDRIDSKYPLKSVSPEEKEKAKSSLNALLENLSVENDQEKEDEDINLRNLLKLQIDKKEMRKEQKKNLGELAYEAAEKVAQDFGGDTKKTTEDLFEHLKEIQITEEAEVQDKIEILKPQLEMKVAKMSVGLEEVLCSDRLGIFKKSSEEEKVEAKAKLMIWDKLEEEELAYMARKSPRNQLEEWILWTEQGKLWQFPIDNDQGMEKEAKVDFTEHVFLEEHLDPWCPKKGPLKKFMDLVLIGLSKNPYLTVEDKKEHIFWYRDYFEKKKKLLQELGAFGGAKEIGESDKSVS